MEFYSDEEYEISNPLNRAQFEEKKFEDLNRDDYLDESKTISVKESNSSRNSNFHFLSIFFDSENNIMKKNTTILNELLAEMDLSLVIENYMNFMDTLDNYRNVSKLNGSFIIKLIKNFLIFYIIGFLFLSVLFDLNLFLFPFFVFLSFFICFIYFRMLVFFFNNFILNLKFYLSSMKNLVYQLKEMEMVSLAGKRRLFVEKNLIKSENSFENDPLKSYRKHVFHRIRHHFYDLKKINQSFNLTNLKNCICTIEIKDLSEIIWQEKENELERLTDFFSINCIKSLMKLNFLLASENLKLIILNYYDLFLIDSSFFQIVYNLAIFGFRLLKVDSLIKKNIEDLTHSLEIIKLTKSDDDLFKLMNKPVSLEHKLNLHLRNAIVNANELEKIGEDKLSLKIETLSLLKHDFEHSNIYLKQLICIIEGEPLQSNIEKLDLSKKQNNDFNLESSHLKNFPVDEEIEDQIFETDTYNLKDKEGRNKHEIEETEESLKEKQNRLASKNFYYELKYALKTKKNEWIEREKAAKKINDETIRSLEHKESFENKDEFDGFHFSQNHLLENEALKYKSELRKRKSTNKLSIKYASTSNNTEDTGLKEIKYKYKYEEFKDDSQSSEKEKTMFKIDSTKIQTVKFSDSVLNEFMLKRNLLMNQKENEEEILYE